MAPPLIEKLKERKPAVLEQVANALHAVFSVVPIMDMTEDLSVGVTHKNPQIRTQSIMLITRQLQTIRRIPSKQEATALAQLMLKTLDDADGTAREVSAEGLGYLMKVVGEKMMRAYIDALDDIKKNKIMEYYGKAETKAIASVTKKHAPSAPKAPVMVQRKVTEENVVVIKHMLTIILTDLHTRSSNHLSLSPPNLNLWSSTTHQRLQQLQYRQNANSPLNFSVKAKAKNQHSPPTD